MKIKQNLGWILALVGILVVGVMIAVGCARFAMRQTNQNTETTAEPKKETVEKQEGDSHPASDAITEPSSDSKETDKAPEATDNTNETEQAESNQNSATESNPASKDDTDRTGGVITVMNGLTEKTTEYEGTKGTGAYNYGEALQKSLIFYELQRSGDLSEGIVRTNWRGNAGLTDGMDVGLDLTGGLNDAGDNMKFNLPMSYTGSVLAWSVYEYGDAYKQSGQLEYMEGTLRWINDYLMKCHPEKNVYYYQVGDGSVDHSFWGACEVVTVQRNSYKVDEAHPGSTPCGEAAASLASAAVVFKDSDPDYATTCLKHAKELYDFAYTSKSNSGYTQANGFYDDYSGFYDELAWAACWLYIATNDKIYLTQAEENLAKKEIDPKWTMCWDDDALGATLMLAKLTGKKEYAKPLEENLAYWTTGMSDGSRITYTPKGLAWLSSWGALRYATTEAYLALVYSDSNICSAADSKKYREFAESQINYALGSSGMSYVIGFGDNYPEHVHHRTAHGAYTNNINDPEESRHTLYGALVGGPDSNDHFSDNRNEYIYTEVGCDYNAGFTGALAALYGVYGGQTLKNFGAVETPEAEELYIEAGVNVDGNDFTEIKAYVYNKTAWPARVTDQLELRYYLDLSEVYEAGGSKDSIVISTNYMQGGTARELMTYDEARHLYYVSIDFDGVEIYPGGQESYRKEVQFRIRNENGAWNPSNDPSFEGLGSTGTVKKTEHVCLYDDGVLVFGEEP